MLKYVIATTKSWNIRNAKEFIAKNEEGYLITEKEQLIQEYLEAVKPSFVFFPHWSWIIPANIYDSYNCVVFHMTDLPFGRGGSPLQNLLARGIYQTKISAIRVSAGVDTGPVYFKEPLDISEGNANEIFSKVSNIVFNRMIPRFLKEENITPTEQTGQVVTFPRRKPEQSEIPNGLSQRQIYDYIRMLDGEGYPAAFKTYDKGKIYFTDAEFTNDTVTAKARFIEE